MSEYLNNAKDTIKNSIPDATAITTGISSAAEGIRSATQQVSDSFSSKSAVSAGSEFLAANGMIAKFVFVILILIAFMFFLNLGVSLVTYLTSPSKSPYIIHGMLPGNAYNVYPQTPGNKSAVIYRSNDQNGGVEFTWSMWLNIMNLNGKDGEVQPIFVKGTDSSYNQDATVNETVYRGLAAVNNGPGAYLISYAGEGHGSNSKEAALLYVMDVVSPKDGATQQKPFSAVIPNLPIGKWVHVAIRLQNKVLDCYVNGVITQRVSFNNFIPKQNYDSIAYAGNGGFNGSTSNLRYYDHALSVFEINSIVYYGPNLKSADTASTSFFDYLGQPWYNYGTNPQLVYNQK